MSDLLKYWLLGFAMMLIIEGLLPFAFPAVWRENFKKLIELSDDQLRVGALMAIIAGVLLLVWIN